MTAHADQYRNYSIVMIVHPTSLCQRTRGNGLFRGGINPPGFPFPRRGERRKKPLSTAEFPASGGRNRRRRVSASPVGRGGIYSVAEWNVCRPAVGRTGEGRADGAESNRIRPGRRFRRCGPPGRRNPLETPFSASRAGNFFFLFGNNPFYPAGMTEQFFRRKTLTYERKWGMIPTRSHPTNSCLDFRYYFRS